MHSQPQENAMQVFVTGATGFVGSAVVRELLAAGHAVTGLARSEAGAAALEAAGARVQRGTLDDLDVLARAAAAADGVVHTGFNHDFSKFAQNCEQDRRAIEAIGRGLEGTRKPLLVTAGLALIAPDRLATETDPPVPVTPSYPRASEHAAAALAARGIHASTVRLPPSVHGAGDHGFVPMLIQLAREKGVSACVEDGSNRWAGVHRVDAARVYRLALERGAVGARYHAVADEGVPMQAIADVIARRLGVPRADLAPDAAAAHFGWFAHFAGIDMAASSAWTREVLGWQPREAGLLDDIASAGYF
jgi:nucleoside-diphosphate-sugar epimerase